MCIVLWGFLRVSSTKCWVSQGFPRGFPGVSVVSSTVASVFEAQSKERAKFLRGGECALFQRGFRRFPLQSVGFPRGSVGFLHSCVHDFCWAQQSGTPSCATSAQERIPSRRRRSVPLPYQQSSLRDPNNSII